jgi:hypothetical protein
MDRHFWRCAATTLFNILALAFVLAVTFVLGRAVITWISEFASRCTL